MNGWWGGRIDGWHDMGAGGMVVGGLVLVVLVVALAGLVTWLVVRRPGRAPRRPDARALLGDRFARGDIDDEEYRRRLDVLDSRP